MRVGEDPYVKLNPQLAAEGDAGASSGARTRLCRYEQV